MSHTFSDGQSHHDISHLAPFTFQVVRPAEGTKAGWTIDVEASFSWHCFTREPEPNENVHKVRRGREVRCFCSKRYSYSFKLPEVIKELANRKVSLTGRGNYVRIELVDDGFVGLSSIQSPGTSPNEPQRFARATERKLSSGF